MAVAVRRADLARAPSHLLASPIWSLRVIEWGVVALVLTGLIWALEHESRAVRGQGEKVAIRATLASLRAALVIDELLGQVRQPAANGTPTTKNPFTLLQAVPPNYAGNLAMRDIYSVPSGSWVFDPECGCVGYRLLYPQWLEPAQVADAIWFRIGAPAVGQTLIPLADYHWFGQRLL